MTTNRNPDTVPETALVSVAGVAGMLGVSNTRLAEYAIARGDIAVEEVGAFYRVNPNEVLELKDKWRQDGPRSGRLVASSAGENT